MPLCPSRSASRRGQPQRSTVTSLIARPCCTQWPRPASRELAARIADADLGGIPVEQAIARLVRGFVAIGSKYVALSSGGYKRTDDHPNVDALLAEPVRELFRRGIADGSLRADLDPELVIDLFSGLVKAALEITSGGRAGVVEAAAAVTAVFLNGTRA